MFSRTKQPEPWHRNLAIGMRNLEPTRTLSPMQPQYSPWRERWIGIAIGLAAGPVVSLILYGWVMWVTRP